jgi:hypothetical protein
MEGKLGLFAKFLLISIGGMFAFISLYTLADIGILALPVIAVLALLWSALLRLLVFMSGEKNDEIIIPIEDDETDRDESGFYSPLSEDRRIRSEPTLSRPDGPNYRRVIGKDARLRALYAASAASRSADTSERDFQREEDNAFADMFRSK